MSVRFILGYVVPRLVIIIIIIISSALKADLAVRGVWQPQCDALFDIRVVNTDAPSYRSRAPTDVLRSAESDKKKKYLQACQDRRAAFTPLCVSVDGLLGKEADFSSIVCVIFCVVSGRNLSA